jgi:hypothetical protein
MINFPATAGQPTDGSFTHSEVGLTWTWNGKTWDVEGGGGAAGPDGCYVGDTPPAGAEPGWLWWNSAEGILYVWYDDGDTQQWVEASPSMGGGNYVSKSGDTMTGPLAIPKVFVGSYGGVTVDADSATGALRFYETAGTQRGAVLKATDCLPGVGSRILTNVNSKVVSEYRFLPNVYASDVNAPLDIHFIDFSGVNCIFAAANSSFMFDGGTNAGLIISVRLLDGTTVIASSYQGCRFSAAANQGTQLTATAFVSQANLNPAKAYKVVATVQKQDAQGPVLGLDAGLAIIGQSIVSGT